MNAKLLTDEALRQDLDIELMFMAGVFGYYMMNPEQMTTERFKHAIDEQIKLLMPTVKRHIKRHVREAHAKDARGSNEVLPKGEVVES